MSTEPKGNGDSRPEFPTYPVSPERKCYVCAWPKWDDDPLYCKKHMFLYQRARKINSRAKNRDNT